MPNSEIRGVVVPILTPLNPDETVDVKSLRRLINYLIDNGVHGIWISGTTGEFASLSDKERLISIETCVDEVAGRVPVIGNVSEASTQLSLNMALAVQEMGLDGVAVTPPYYFPNAQDEVLDHYRYLKDRSGLPLWVYNIPQTVKTAVAPGTIATLASEGAVVGVKDSSGAGELLAELNVMCEQGDLQLLRFLGTMFRITSAGSVGVHGVIPALANLAPAAAARGWEAGEAGDAATVKECNAKLLIAAGIARLSKGGGPNAASLAGMKAALKLMGILDSDTVTRPLRPLTDEEKQGIPGILANLGLSNGA
ncbi:MAG: dihydrodipicolinate synthase family protein [Dehalococcoidia bacterium]|jgi:4-hydroxy-tetrahydrodipicolinate synthase|nr:dihydrodipicolinate synthase family protein [Dehalococcoidia bacterium]MDP7084357.1 dihydrodipicolinate synthase family protein [Dehalococcoidia bacterium]MDP7201267.1 dihydrodipicolinate synthase family protein [Dehalococcoidia bacterium]MDP7509275.1 dihydrodipicolinate synthase family protein [Dehalococcoidia bacterium]HJN87622.1 dihydrodipicolinate synthase family protein [Dehalococcoidia bacterium]